MRYLVLFFLFISFSAFSQQAPITKDIDNLYKKILKVKTLTQIEQLDLDNEIMEMQFETVNDFFEELRTKLSDIEIIEEEIDNPKNK